MEHVHHSHLPQRMNIWANYQHRLVEIDSGSDEMEHAQHGHFHERMDGGVSGYNSKREYLHHQNLARCHTINIILFQNL